MRFAYNSSKSKTFEKRLFHDKFKSYKKYYVDRKYDNNQSSVILI